MDATVSFGERHFGQAELGHCWRTRRLVMIADQLVARPHGSLPQRLQDPAALKACYRLMNRPEVTHASVLASHQAEVCRQISEHAGPLLAICDTTELDFTTRTSLEKLGPIGNGRNRGYLCHNVLIVDPRERGVLGLAAQILHTRTPCKGEKRMAKRSRASRESRLWSTGTESLVDTSRLTVVADRGADIFEFLAHEMRSSRNFVVRSGFIRNIRPGHSEPADVVKVHPYMQSLPAQSTMKVDLRATPQRSARTATLQLSWTPLRLNSPPQRRGEHPTQPLAVWCVRVWEANPPADEEPVEWFLYTRQPVTSAAAACQVVNWYSCRWVIEEYHKGLKTGCQIQALQFADEARLEPTIALLSVVALFLLQLRDAARDPELAQQPATRVMPASYVRLLSLWRHGEERPAWTVQEFALALARLGGHQNRKGDKRPGWIILWRGWQALQLMTTGANLQDLSNKLG